MNHDQTVFGIREAAAFLGAHEQTVRRLARRRAIPSFKVGKDWRFRKEALLRWVEEQHSASKRESLPILRDGMGDYPSTPRQNGPRNSMAASLDAVRLHAAAHRHGAGTALSDAEDRDLAAKVLSYVGAPDSLRNLLQIATLCLQKWLGCDAVGFRLREGLDFPYYETRGFPEEFVLVEKYLCARDSMNELLRDSDGNPLLECMCGNVICGRFDASKPFFTEHGSFWSNSTTELLASTTEEDRQARTRNRCNGEGYESVALFPLKFETEILGLLQINHRRKGFFSVELITLLERFAESMALVITQDQEIRSRTNDNVPASRRLDGRKGMIVAGRSVLPAESSPSGVAANMILEVALDTSTHRVLTVACDAVPKLAQEMLAHLLVGKTLPGALHEAKKGLTNGYYSELRKPVMAALEDVLRNYREIDRRVTGVDPGKLCVVLIIDDDETFCKELAMIVGRCGCRAQVATSAAKGLELVAQGVPDLILLDLVMPGMNGPQFLEELRTAYPNLPVVIVTAYPHGELMAEAMKHGPLILLAKPAEAAQVERVVNMVVGDRLARNVSIEPYISALQGAGGYGAIR